MTRPRKEVNDADFARLVMALCRDAMLISRGELARSKIKDAPSEARALASGLAAIRQLVEQELAGCSPGDARDRGIKDAFDLITALMEGQRHPIFDYARGIQKTGKKVGSLSVQERFRRALAVALYRALGANRAADQAVKRALLVDRTTLMTWARAATEDGDRFPFALEYQIRMKAGEASSSALIVAAVDLYHKGVSSPTIG